MPTAITFGAISARAIGFLASNIRDPFFRYVSLLLNTGSTNGAQNNTFLDSSTNNFTVTRNGNTTQGSFTPYWTDGQWSNYFAGSSNYLQFTAQIFNGDFCAEAWIFRTADAPQYSVIFGSSGPTLGATNHQFTVRNNGGIQMVLAGAVVISSSGTAVVSNQWNHCVWVRSGTDCAVFVNGVRQGTATSSTNTSSCNRINDIGNLSGYGLTGYISNARIVIGSSVYDPTSTTLTVPQAPLTNITNTTLLTCQSNRFLDNSSSALAITLGGTPSVQTFNSFAPNLSYNTPTYGGSGYFDGAGDYLSIADSATIRFGSGTFTIQCWVYRNAADVTHTIAAKGGASTGWVFQITSTNVLRFTHTTTNIDTTTTIPSSTWTHVAVVRSGTGSNQLKLYINGVDSATGTSSTNFNQTEALNIAADRGNANTMNGYISNLKYNVGTAETITVPTAPVTGGTALLNFTNAGIYDAAVMNDLETVGNAQVSTTQAKFGSTSVSFDGTGDWLLTLDRLPLRLGTANFTIEGWIYLNAINTAYGIVSKGTASTGWSVNVTSGNKLQFSYTSSNLTGATSLAANTWYYFAVVRSGTATGNLKIYLSGTADATSAGAVNDNFNQTSNMYVGADRVGGSALNGYIDELRITNGVARYTTNFTSPGAAFPIS